MSSFKYWDGVKLVELASVDELPTVPEIPESTPLENGFDDRAESTIAFDEGTRTFTITPTGAEFFYNTGGSRYSKDAADTLVISDVSGDHFIYYDGETLSETTSFTPDLIIEFAFVAIVYWNAVDGEATFFGDERHGNIMDSRTHQYNHSTLGARFGEGLAITNMIADGSGANDSSAQFGFSNGEIWDEDIRHTIVDGAPQELAPIAQIPILYRDGAAGIWKRIAPTNFPLTTTGSGRAAWNEWTGTTWRLTEVDNADFVCVHYFAVNGVNDQIIGILGQAEYNTLGNARDGVLVEIKNLSFGQLESLTPEFVALVTVLFQTSDSYSNAVKSVVQSVDVNVDFFDWRRGITGSGGSSADGIGEAPVDGQEYVRKDSAWAVASGGGGGGVEFQPGVLRDGLYNSDSTMDTTAVVDVPDHKEGDLLVVVLTWRGTDAITSPPAGWTEQARNIGQAEGGFGFQYFWIYTKVASASEPATYTWTGNSDRNMWAAFAVAGGEYTGYDFVYQASGSSVDIGTHADELSLLVGTAVYGSAPLTLSGTDVVTLTQLGGPTEKRSVAGRTYTSGTVTFTGSPSGANYLINVRMVSADAENLVEEAPEDGQEYVRKDAAWAVATPKVFTGASTPTANAVGDMWVQTADVRIWDGTSWVTVS